VAACESGFEQGGCFGWMDPRFGRIEAGIDLKEDGKRPIGLARCSLERIEQPDAVDALNAIEGLRGKARLVGLEVADQFPGNRGLRVLALRGGFLNAILPNGAQAGPCRVVGRFGRMGLGHSKNLHAPGASAAARAGLVDLTAQRGETFGKSLEGDEHGVRESN